jgi:hypothetical protein
VARKTIAPGRGGTYTSGSTRVVVTSADSCTSAGSTPSSIRNTSDANCAPSCRARTCVTTPDAVTAPTPGTSRLVTTMSSNCRYAPGATATQNSSGVASSTPSTRPADTPSLVTTATRYRRPPRTGGNPAVSCGGR